MEYDRPVEADRGARGALIGPVPMHGLNTGSNREQPDQRVRCCSRVDRPGISASVWQGPDIIQHVGARGRDFSYADPSAQVFT